DTLSEREAGVISLRFGLESEPMTLDEIGKVYGVTRERIRQIEKKTLEMLRHPSRSDALRDYARWLFGIPVRPTHQEHADSGTIPIVSRRAPSADSASPGVN